VREEAGEREWSYKESLIDGHYRQLQEYTHSHGHCVLWQESLE